MNEELHTVVEEGSQYFLDLDYHVEYKVYPYYIEFVVRRVNPSRNVETNEVSYYWQGEMGPTLDKAESEIELEGSVKWDGCSNWDFHPGDKGVMEGTDNQLRFMKHFCEREQMVQWGELLGRLWDMGEKVPHWDCPYKAKRSTKVED